MLHVVALQAVTTKSKLDVGTTWGLKHRFPKQVKILCMQDVPPRKSIQSVTIAYCRHHYHFVNLFTFASL